MKYSYSLNIEWSSKEKNGLNKLSPENKFFPNIVLNQRSIIVNIMYVY